MIILVSFATLLTEPLILSKKKLTDNSIYSKYINIFFTQLCKILVLLKIENKKLNNLLYYYFIVSYSVL